MRFFKVVFPTLPVIPIICAEVLSLVAIAKSFKEEKVFLQLSFFIKIRFFMVCYPYFFDDEAYEVSG